MNAEPNFRLRGIMLGTAPTLAVASSECAGLIRNHHRSERNGIVCQKPRQRKEWSSDGWRFSRSTGNRAPNAESPTRDAFMISTTQKEPNGTPKTLLRKSYGMEKKLTSKGSSKSAFCCARTAIALNMGASATALNDRKDEFRIEAVIGMVKSTNHRFRVVTIFCKANKEFCHPC